LRYRPQLGFRSSGNDGTLLISSLICGAGNTEDD